MDEKCSRDLWSLIPTSWVVDQATNARSVCPSPHRRTWAVQSSACPRVRTSPSSSGSRRSWTGSWQQEPPRRRPRASVYGAWTTSTTTSSWISRSSTCTRCRQGRGRRGRAVARGRPARPRTVLRDAVVLALPLNPVCDPECPGLCPECGARLADDPDHTHGEAIDPRWAALSQLDRHSPTSRSRSWQYRSGSCRAATRATAGRSGRRRPPSSSTARTRRATPRSPPHRACPSCGQYGPRGERRQVL